MSVGAVLLARDGPLATVTLSNPGKKNALDAAMCAALACSRGRRSCRKNCGLPLPS